MKHILLASCLALLVFGCIIALPSFANAAPLSYTAPTMISLTSPTTTLTITSGSVADALTVNATSALVTLSQTTGGSFTILSPSYDLSVATSSGGGIVSVSCGNGIETAIISQSTGSTVYTVTPGGTNCANASPPIVTAIAATNVTTTGATITWSTNIAADSTVSYGTTASYGLTSTNPTLITGHSVVIENLSASTLYHFAVASAAYGTSTTSGDNTLTTAGVSTGGGLSVSVASQYGAPYVPGTGFAPSGTQASNATQPSNPSSTPLVSPTVPTATPSTATLQARLQSLQAQLAALMNSSTVTPAFPRFVFTRNLSLDITGNDVKQLQVFLIAQDSGPAARALKAHGTTKNFATLTRNALIEFQKKVGITPASGYFGPITRAYVNNLTP